MNKKQSYRTIPFTTNRRMVAASAAAGRDQNNIEALIEVDISEPRRLMRAYKQRTGESLSLTAYVVASLAQTVGEFPEFNAIRKGGKILIFDDVTVGVLVERELDGEIVPDNLGVRAAQAKTYRQILDEIRGAQEHEDDGLGGLSGATWVRFIPSFLFRIFIRIASRNAAMIERYGAVAVTAVGMFGARNQAMWLVPLVGGATVGVAVGGIVERPCVRDGQLESHEHLCLTVTFNHDIVDGAPAARFVKRFSELLMSAEPLRAERETLWGELQRAEQKTQRAEHGAMLEA